MFWPCIYCSSYFFLYKSSAYFTALYVEKVGIKSRRHAVQNMKLCENTTIGSLPSIKCQDFFPIKIYTHIMNKHESVI